MLKPLTVWITTNCGKLLKRREYQTSLLVSWETYMQVRKQQLEPCLYGTSNWFRTEKGVWQSCLLSPCLFNLYAQHIIRKTGLNELQAGIKIGRRNINNLQFSSLAQSCLTLHDPLDCSMPGLPIYHQLLEFTQSHVHWIGGAIQPSHPLSSPSPPAFNLSKHQGLFKWVSSSNQLAKVLELQL